MGKSSYSGAVSGIPGALEMRAEGVLVLGDLGVSGSPGEGSGNGGVGGGLVSFRS